MVNSREVDRPSSDSAILPTRISPPRERNSYEGVLVLLVSFLCACAFMLAIGLGISKGLTASAQAIEEATQGQEKHPAEPIAG